MSKEATIIQLFNDVKQQYEYSVKDYDVTESVKILLKRHKEEYDKEKNVFAGTQGFIEAQQLYEKHIADLEAKLAEKDKEIEKLKIILNMQAVQVSEEQRLSLINTNCIQYNQNQIAIEQLEKLLEKTQTLNLMVKSGHYVNQKQVKVVFEDVIMQKISELKGDENEKEN